MRRGGELAASVDKEPSEISRGQAKKPDMLIYLGILIYTSGRLRNMRYVRACVRVCARLPVRAG